MKVLSYDELQSQKGINYCRQWILKLVQAGKFPKPVTLGGHRVAFVEHEIDAWLADRIRARDAEAV